MASLKIAQVPPSLSPLPPHTLKFIQSASPKTLINILSSWSVRLDSGTFSKPSPSTRSELECRIKLLLSDSQRLAIVLPLSKTTYLALPQWAPTGAPPPLNLKPGTGPIALKYSQCASFGQILSAKTHGDEITREIGEDVYTDVCQTLMSIAHGYDIGHGIFSLQDTRQTSAISIRIVDAKTALLDKTLPLIFVLFYHETREHTSPNSPAFRWMQHQMGTGPIHSVTSPLEEQQLILRQLIYNSHRLPPGCEAMYSGARNIYEKDFIPSFLLPLDTLSQSALTNLNRTNACAMCSLPASFLCDACCILHYCSTTCQRDHRATHKPFCMRISAATHSVIAHASLKTESILSLGPQVFTTNLSRHLSQRDMTRISADGDNFSALSDEGILLSRKRRGAKERFIVKMQVPMMPGGDLMIYDAERMFQAFVERGRDLTVYAKLMELAKNSVRWGGMKVFVYARHVEGEKNKEKLEILTGVLPDQEQFW